MLRLPHPTLARLPISLLLLLILRSAHGDALGRTAVNLLQVRTLVLVIIPLQLRVLPVEVHLWRRPSAASGLRARVPSRAVTLRMRVEGGAALSPPWTSMKGHSACRSGTGTVRSRGTGVLPGSAPRRRGGSCPNSGAGHLRAPCGGGAHAGPLHRRPCPAAALTFECPAAPPLRSARPAFPPPLFVRLAAAFASNSFVVCLVFLPFLPMPGTPQPGTPATPAVGAGPGRRSPVQVFVCKKNAALDKPCRC